ncbi:BRO-N domain-containing protein [Peterkaempfera bronchialis]|nr:Bro-N domain-containing protein [Peterkaempfera bronchialis]
MTPHTHSSELVRLDFQGGEVRVVIIDGDPWWVASDVCGALDISQTHRALAGLDDDEKGRHTMTTPGGDQQVSIINEPGLYSLILRSRKPEAKAFKRWVVHEVLPTIRRTGRYAVDERPASDLPVDMHAFLREVSQVATEAAVAAAREATREATLSFRETLAETRDAFREAVAEMRDTFTETVREVTAAHAAVPPPRHPLDQPIWHPHIPRDALSFGELADAFSAEFDRPGISRETLLTVARDAGLIALVPAPNAGHTLADVRLQSLFRVRRIDGSRRCWSCAYHFQPVVLPDGVAIMRQLVAQDVDRGIL